MAIQQSQPGTARLAGDRLRRPGRTVRRRGNLVIPAIQGTGGCQPSWAGEGAASGARYPAPQPVHQEPLPGSDPAGAVAEPELSVSQGTLGLYRRRAVAACQRTGRGAIATRQARPDSDLRLVQIATGTGAETGIHLGQGRLSAYWKAGSGSVRRVAAKPAAGTATVWAGRGRRRWERPPWLSAARRIPPLASCTAGRKGRGIDRFLPRRQRLFPRLLPDGRGATARPPPDPVRTRSARAYRAGRSEDSGRTRGTLPQGRPAGALLFAHHGAGRGHCHPQYRLYAQCTADPGQLCPAQRAGRALRPAGAGHHLLRGSQPARSVFLPGPCTGSPWRGQPAVTGPGQRGTGRRPPARGLAQ